MAETPAPLLVHNRIDANRRNTRLLLVCFGVLVLPVTWGIAQLAASLMVILSTPGTLRELPFEGSWGFNGVAFGLGALATILMVAVLYLSSLFSSFLLWKSGAQLLGSNHPELRKLVESLCIGIGLPVPSIYITSSDLPNAFAVSHGRTASLVVSRGLLTLLDRRELAGVLAHELSHIANHDTDLSTLLAAFATVARLPQRMFMGAFSFLPLFGSVPAAIATAVFGFIAFYLAVVTGVSAISLLLAWYGHEATDVSSWMAIAMFAPLYVLVVAPALAAFVRKSISHEREFLADADAALLTRDPEGLALALAKVSAAAGTPVSRDPAIAHLFFIDPSPPSRFAWIRGIFPTHPPVDQRVALLRRMGDGIVEGLTAATDAGVGYRRDMVLEPYARAGQSQ